MRLRTLRAGGLVSRQAQTTCDRCGAFESDDPERVGAIHVGWTRLTLNGAVRLTLDLCPSHGPDMERAIQDEMGNDDE